MVTTGFDRIVIQVPDLQGAAREYRDLLGAAGDHPGAEQRDGRRFWLTLPNTVIELVETDTAQARIAGLVFVSSRAGHRDQPWPNTLGLQLALCDGSATADFRRRLRADGAGAMAVDHLVLRTADADACIRTFSNDLGLRLALDRTVPEWGGRMLFFRAGKLTLEVIEPLTKPAAGNSFWGIAYRCSDIESTCSRLAASGVELSEIRPGRKPGTRVATVRSRCLGIPTLLLESSSAG